MSILGVNPQTIYSLVMCALLILRLIYQPLYVSTGWQSARQAARINTTCRPNRALRMETVQQQAQKAGIGMPEVAIFDANEMNAFATGASRNNSLVAVSSGLLYNMSQGEAEAVLAHEVSHIANGDMVTMALLQGVLNTFVMFAARIIASIIDALRSSDDEGQGLGFFAHMAVVFVLDILFGFLAALVINAYSAYHREYAADAVVQRFPSKEKMIAALQRPKHHTKAKCLIKLLHLVSTVKNRYQK